MVFVKLCVAYRSFVYPVFKVLSTFRTNSQFSIQILHPVEHNIVHHRYFFYKRANECHYLSAVI